jgi:guanine deaminase
MDKTDFMNEAINEAKKAIKTGEGMAFGAVIVKDGKIVGRGYNSVVKNKDPTNHAEMNAIRSACKNLNTENLQGCTLYSTCEPCPMCFTALWWANISNLIFGGTLEDVTNISREILVSSEFLNKKSGSKIKIEKGFLKDKCLELYK